MNFFEKLGKAMCDFWDSLTHNVKGSQKCPQCGAEIARNAVFCDKCGAKTEEPAAPDVNKTETSFGGPICPVCKKPVLSENTFCTFCGASLSNTAKPEKAEALASEKADSDVKEQPEQKEN